MHLIRKNIVITIILVLGLIAAFPLAASSDKTLSEEQLRLKILGVIPAQHTPDATEEVATDEAEPEAPLSEDENNEDHPEDHSMMPEMETMDEAHGMPHQDDTPMMMESQEMDAHHEDGMPMMEDSHEADEHHETSEKHISEEKKMMESAHAPAGIKVQEKDAHQDEVHWSYEGSGGPGFWGDLKNEFTTCKSGKSQSPIDISDVIVTELSKIQIDYQDTPLHIVNNGHTIQANYQPGSSITIGSKQFELLQFHFHSPSEHTVGGKAYPMVVHLVHKAADGQLGVIGVLLKEGQPNALIDKLWAHLPQNAGEENTLEGENINVTGLLPKDMTYFNYSGSLTTPPCSEGVNWMLLAAPAELSAEQISQFRSLYESNARPVQAVNGRPVGLSN